MSANKQNKPQLPASIQYATPGEIKALRQLALQIQNIVTAIENRQPVPVIETETSNGNDSTRQAKD